MSGQSNSMNGHNIPRLPLARFDNDQMRSNNYVVNGWAQGRDARNCHDNGDDSFRGGVGNTGLRDSSNSNKNNDNDTNNNYTSDNNVNNNVNNNYCNDAKNNTSNNDSNIVPPVFDSRPSHVKRDPLFRYSATSTNNFDNNFENRQTAIHNDNGLNGDKRMTYINPSMNNNVNVENVVSMTRTPISGNPRQNTTINSNPFSPYGRPPPLVFNSSSSSLTPSPSFPSQAPSSSSSFSSTVFPIPQYKHPLDASSSENNGRPLGAVSRTHEIQDQHDHESHVLFHSRTHDKNVDTTSRIVVDVDEVEERRHGTMKTASNIKERQSFYPPKRGVGGDRNMEYREKEVSGRNYTMSGYNNNTNENSSNMGGRSGSSNGNSSSMGGSSYGTYGNSSSMGSRIGTTASSTMARTSFSSSCLNGEMEPRNGYASVDPRNGATKMVDKSTSTDVSPAHASENRGSDVTHHHTTNGNVTTHTNTYQKHMLPFSSTSYSSSSKAAPRLNTSVQEEATTWSSWMPDHHDNDNDLTSYGQTTVPVPVPVPSSMSTSAHQRDTFFGTQPSGRRNNENSSSLSLKPPEPAANALSYADLMVPFPSIAFKPLTAHTRSPENTNATWGGPFPSTSFRPQERWSSGEKETIKGAAPRQEKGMGDNGNVSAVVSAPPRSHYPHLEVPFASVSYGPAHRSHQ